MDLAGLEDDPDFWNYGLDDEDANPTPNPLIVRDLRGADQGLIVTC